MEELLKTRLETADDLLSKASDELCKPEEDVVPYSVCRNAYMATLNYLGSYLTQHGEPFMESTSIEDLLRRCREIEPAFTDLHLGPLYHPSHTEDIWMSMKTAKSFMSMALNTRKMVVEHSK